MNDQFKHPTIFERDLTEQEQDQAELDLIEGKKRFLEGLRWSDNDLEALTSAVDMIVELGDFLRFYPEAVAEAWKAANNTTDEDPEKLLERLLAIREVTDFNKTVETELRKKLAEAAREGNVPTVDGYTVRLYKAGIIDETKAPPEVFVYQPAINVKRLVALADGGDKHAENVRAWMANRGIYTLKRKVHPSNEKDPENIRWAVKVVKAK